jgi:hypothetical protein
MICMIKNNLNIFFFIVFLVIILHKKIGIPNHPFNQYRQSSAVDIS